MIRLFIASLTLACLPIAAHAQEMVFEKAAYAFIAGDTSQLPLIATYAETGNPTALAIMGQAYYYGQGVPRDRIRALTYLEQAANGGDWPAAEQLGSIYEYGNPDTPKDTAKASKWYVIAVRNGDKYGSTRALQRMPRAEVIAAGGEDLLPAAALPRPAPAPSPVARVAPVSPPAPTQPSPRPTAPPPSPPPAPVTPTVTKPAGPAPLTLIDGTIFPRLADTAFNDLGDAAASCFFVMAPEVTRLSNDLDALDANAGAPRASGALADYGKRLDLETKLEIALTTYDAALDIIQSPTRNGGVTAELRTIALRPHMQAHQTRPHTGPSPKLCNDYLIGLTVR